MSRRALLVTARGEVHLMLTLRKTGQKQQPDGMHPPGWLDVSGY
jgi:hypothetical protein